MVSRRKILSRSRDDLNLDQVYTKQQMMEDAEEDIWYQKEKLFKVSRRFVICSEIRQYFGSVSRHIIRSIAIFVHDYTLRIQFSSLNEERCSRNSVLANHNHVTILLYLREANFISFLIKVKADYGVLCVKFTCLKC